MLGLAAVSVLLALVAMCLGTAVMQAQLSWQTSQTSLKINQVAAMVHSEMLLVGGAPPARLQDLRGVKPDMLLDRWGHPLHYVTPGPDNTPFDITSYGRDGRPGGIGRDKDIRYSEM